MSKLPGHSYRYQKIIFQILFWSKNKLCRFKCHNHNLLLSGKKHKDKANKEKEKVKENEFPKGAMEGSEKDTRKELIKIKGADDSVRITENSVRITDHSVGITETIVRITDNRVGITDKYVRILERDEETVIVEDSLGVTKTKKGNKRSLDEAFDQSEFNENLDEKKFKKDV